MKGPRLILALSAKNGETGVFSFPQLYTEALLAESQARLDRASAAVPADSLHAKQVAFIQTGLTYTKLQLENITPMERYWKEKDETIAEKVKQNWATIETLVARQPYSLSWGPIRPATPRMTGLHPDYPPAKFKTGKGERSRFVKQRSLHPS